MNMNQLFFELIQVSIGTRICLSHTPTADEWGELYAMAKKQSLVGVCFAGVQRLQGQQQTPPEMLYLTCMGMAAKIQQLNEVVNRQCVELQVKLSADGLRSSVLKGQAVGQYYGQLAALCQSGDIDIYVDCGREKAIEYARKLQGDVDWDYKHLHLHVFPDTEVEMHYVPEVFLNLWKNRKLQKWFKEHQGLMFTNTNLLNSSNPSNISTPSTEFNLFYILLHMYRHFLYEGVGLRQLMDFYFVLCEAQTKGFKVSKVCASHPSDSLSSRDWPSVSSEFQALLKQFGMMRFAKGVMWIMAYVFANENNDENENLFLGIKPDEKEGRYVLEQVMMGGNFGHHDERLANSSNGKWSAIRKILKHNLHLLAHYPSDVIWAPIWIVYHKIWKLVNR